MSLPNLLYRSSIVCLLVGAVGCSLSSITDSAKTTDGELVDPKVVESKEGAQWIYLGAVAKFYHEVTGLMLMNVGRFTDEIALLSTKNQAGLDARINVSTTTPGNRVLAGIGNIHSVKVQLEQAIQLVSKHHGPAGNAILAHSYGLLAMTYLSVGDNFCSGIAMSVSNYGGELILGPGLSTDSIYARAITAADKGLALAVDSVPLTRFLKGLKARALNATGKYKAAADLTSDIPDDYVISELFQPSAPGLSTDFQYGSRVAYTENYNVINGKGGNGLEWIAMNPADQDMRIPIRLGTSGVPILPVNTDFPFDNRRISFFSGAEARLIEAEYYLSIDNPTEFMKKINAVRRLYKYRSGAVLADTVDPGSHDARVDLLFRERAYTFYMTGRRLGDLRRLTKYYGRDPETIWPTGRSEGQQFIVYGDNYVFVPEFEGLGSETNFNPNYKGCESYEP